MTASTPKDPSAAPSARAPRAFPVRTEKVRCVVCGADEARPYRGGMYRIGATSFDLVRCACGMVYVNPSPDGPTLGAMYDDPDYYTHGYNLGVETENYFARKDELLAHYDGVVAAYERETGLAKGALFELGSAGGFFLEAARRRGWKVQGVELSPPAAEYSIRELGLPVFRGLLEEAPFPPASFDLALADNVLEHTTDPQRVLQKLRELLRPGGALIVICPSYVNSPYFRAMQLLQKLVPRALLGPQTLKLLKFDGADNGYPYHILEFDLRALRTLAERAGFTVERVERSVPLPAHLFKARAPTLAQRLQRAIFRTLYGGMRIGALPGARVRLVLRPAPGA
ncbi:MAG: methyltransferase domain-containing protein [Planctomycetota bacterium]|nr:methyltransferase domain-containing protein [Planctomycetota bacterium]